MGKAGRAVLRRSFIRPVCIPGVERYREGTMALRAKSRLSQRRMLEDYTFLTPQLLLYVGLIIVPFFVALPMLFTDRATFQSTNPQFIGLANFTRVFTDPAVANEYWPALGRTALFTVLNYATVYIFGLSLALLIYEIGFNSGFFTIIYLPMMASALAVGWMADMLFSQSTGTVNLLFKELGLPWTININDTSGVMIVLPLITGWRWAGFNMAIFLAGLLSIPTETIEASVVDGASYWQRLTKVYFPQMIPSFIIATIFCLIGSFGIFDEAIALGALIGNQEVRFLAVLFFIYAFGGQKLALAMTLALQTFVPLVLIAVLLQRLQRKVSYY
jgi:ABC-type sugar transport system permease subunit